MYMIDEPLEVLLERERAVFKARILRLEAALSTIATQGYEIPRDLAKKALLDGGRCDHKFIDSKSCVKCGWTP